MEYPAIKVDSSVQQLCTIDFEQLCHSRSYNGVFVNGLEDRWTNFKSSITKYLDEQDVKFITTANGVNDDVITFMMLAKYLCANHTINMVAKGSKKKSTVKTSSTQATQAFLTVGEVNPYFFGFTIVTLTNVFVTLTNIFVTLTNIFVTFVLIS